MKQNVMCCEIIHMQNMYLTGQQFNSIDLFPSQFLWLMNVSFDAVHISVTVQCQTLYLHVCVYV